MSALRAGSILLFLLATAGTVYGEEITIRSYYPIPDGEYRKLSTSEKTTLATGSAPTARVAIGTKTPETNRVFYRDSATPVNKNIMLDVKKIDVTTGNIMPGQANIVADDVYLAAPAYGPARWVSQAWWDRPVRFYVNFNNVPDGAATTARAECTAGDYLVSGGIRGAAGFNLESSYRFMDFAPTAWECRWGPGNNRVCYAVCLHMT